jgi:hypothetical protein
MTILVADLRRHRVVHVLVIIIPVSDLLFDHVRAAGVELFGVSGDLGHSDLGLVAVRVGGRYGQEAET